MLKQLPQNIKNVYFHLPLPFSVFGSGSRVFSSSPSRSSPHSNKSRGSELNWFCVCSVLINLMDFCSTVSVVIRFSSHHLHVWQFDRQGIRSNSVSFSRTACALSLFIFCCCKCWCALGVNWHIPSSSIRRCHNIFFPSFWIVLKFAMENVETLYLRCTASHIYFDCNYCYGLQRIVNLCCLLAWPRCFHSSVKRFSCDIANHRRGIHI